MLECVKGLASTPLGLAIAVLTGGMMVIVVVYASENRIPSYEELPDGALINNTKDPSEVKAFLAKYPDAGAQTDRSGRLAVDCRQDYPEVTLNRSGTEYHPYVQLRIFMSPEGAPEEMFVGCYNVNDKWISEHNDIISFLQTETCFG